MKERIVITGVNGNIGTILQQGLTDFDITTMDLPDGDVRDYQKLIQIFPGHQAVIHLAWNSQKENLLNNKLDPDCRLMYENVYKAALETRISRVIMASSIHADAFYLPRGERILTTSDIPYPDSPYGVDKIEMEKLGAEYAKKGLEVICIRFGGVATVLDAPNPKARGSLAEIAERAARISHRDTVSLVRKCLQAETVPNNFVVIYGISDNYGSIHDISNPFGWKPLDGTPKV
jgi:nucleoside-diphosphate-sugar epimerase